MKKNDIVVGTCIDYDHQGHGVVKIDGFVLFVKGLLVDEKAEIKVVKVNKKQGYGIIHQLLVVSKHRVQPQCNVYRKCGGCSLMHMDYQEQLRFKTNHVKSCFKSLQLSDLVSNTLGCVNQTNYRNKVQIPLMFDQKWKYGFYRDRSHDLVEFDTCLIQEQWANNFLPSFMEALNSTSITSGIRHLVLKMFNDQVMMILVVEKPLDNNNLATISECAKNHGVTSFYQNVHPDNSNVVLTLDNIKVFGEDTILAKCLDNHYQVSVNSFYQVNSTQMEVLYQQAYDYANVTSNDTVLDLYCGTGTIGLGVAKHIQSLIGVDVVESSIENAKTNARLNNINNATFYCMDAGKAAVELLNKELSFDVIFVDPPRKGCDQTTLNALLQFKPKRIVYISCNPSTLARDCAHLQQMYSIDAIQPVDMFPQSHHIETVCLLSLK